MGFRVDIVLDGMKTTLISLYNFVRTLRQPGTLSVNSNILKGFFKDQFDETSIEKSKKVGKGYRKLAKLYNCKIFDINDFTTPSDIDGLHYDETSHKLIGEKLTEFINNLT